MSKEEEEDASERVSVQSRIAALNKNKATTLELIRPPDPNRLRKTPSTSALLTERQRRPMAANVDSENDDEERGPLPPAVPGRPRSNTGAGTPPVSNGRQSPRLDVKGIIALYGQQSADKGTSSSPVVPSRPTQAVENASERPAPTVVPPQLPPRMRSDVSQRNTGANLSSSSSGNDTKPPPLPSAVPYETRRTTVRQQSTTPALPARPLGNLSKAALRSADDVRTPTEGRNAAPRPPPRLMRNTLDPSRSLDTIPSKQGAFTPPSQPGSPRAAARAPVTATTARQTSSPLSAARSVSNPPSSSLLPTSLDSGTLTPPPRHIDARRNAPGLSRLGALEIARQSSSSRMQRGGRCGKRRRDEKALMAFAKEPADQIAKERYDALFDSLCNGGVVEQRTVVRIWRRSKLDAWFLGQVWQSAMERSGTGGMTREPFLQAMSAIDAELTRRKM